MAFAALDTVESSQAFFVTKPNSCVRSEPASQPAASGTRDELGACGICCSESSIGESAADLLCGGDLSRVKECANSGCGAFLYDTSKNRGRRWCTTTGCGNRMRVAAFYDRQRRDD